MPKHSALESIDQDLQEMQDLLGGQQRAYDS